MSLSVCCVNVRGVRQAEKRRDVFHYLRSLRCALYSIVDTHFTADMEAMVRAEWGGQVVLSYGTANSRGVAILVNPSAAVIVHGSEVDSGGNYIILDVEFDGFFKCKYVVLYGPNDDRPEFFEELFDKVNDTLEYPVVIVGDWNLVLDPEKDTKFYANVGNLRARKIVLDVIENDNLVDIWRVQHVDTRRFTWKRSNPVKYSRLDFFLVSQELLHSISASHIVSGYRTDHNVVTLLLKKVELPKRNLFWKFNNSLLDDKNFISFIKKEITYMKEMYALPVYSRASIESDQDIQFSVTDKLFFETLMSHLRGVIVQYSARRKRMQDGQENILCDVLITWIAWLRKMKQSSRN